MPGSPSGHVPRLLALKFKCTTTKHNATLFLTGLTKALEKTCVVLDMHEYISNIEKGTWLYNYYYGHTCKIKAAALMVVQGCHAMVHCMLLSYKIIMYRSEANIG